MRQLLYIIISRYFRQKKKDKKLEFRGDTDIQGVRC